MNNQNNVEKIIGFLKENNQDKAEKLKLEMLPSSLYRYRKSDENTIDCLKRNSIWLSNFKELNDPFECLTKFNLDKYFREFFLETNFEGDFFDLFKFHLSPEEIKIIRSSYEPQKVYYDICERKNLSNFKRPSISFAKEYAIGVLDKYREYCYIGCFSERADSLLMWSHYADSGKGICVEYCLNNIDHSYLFPVFYSSEMYDFSVKESSMLLRTLIKAKDWQYEQEWRLVYMSSNMNPNNHHVKIPIPSKILLGPRFEDNSTNRKNELKEVAALLNIPLVKTTLHSTEYKIVNGVVY